MKNIVSALVRFLPLVFITSIIYLTVRLYVIYSNKVVTYNQNKVITFNSLDEMTIVTVLILAVVIVVLPLFSKAKAEVIYVDKFETAKTKVDDSSFLKNNSIKLEEYRRMSEKVLSSGNNDGMVSEKLFAGICSLLNAGQGALYKVDNVSKQVCIEASYAFVRCEQQTLAYNLGEGLIGMAAKENRIMKMNHIPQGYLNIFSGLGTASPSILHIIPFADEVGRVVGVIEMAMFSELPSGANEALELAKKDFLTLFNN